MKIVAISGSLRAGSSNSAVLRAAAGLVPQDMELILYEGIGGLPHFNPDLDGEGQPPMPEVGAFRAALEAADGVIISSPEYAHGVPGSLKNALDWIVSSGELGGKPVLLINTSAGGAQWAHASLIETLSVMDARVLTEATVFIPFARTKVGSDARTISDDIARPLRAGLDALAHELRGA